MNKPKAFSTRDFMTGDNKTYQSYVAIKPSEKAALEIESFYTRFLTERDTAPSFKDIAQIIEKHYAEYQKAKDDAEAELFDRLANMDLT